jgi:putative ABC transport system permease protein
MSLWRQLTRGLRVLANRTTADGELSDEVRDYLEQATAAGVAHGLSPEDAHRAARLELGNLTTVREQVRAYGWENMIGTLLADLRHAARRLRRNPGFTTIAVLTLALGIGATTAIFSTVNPILFTSLPYPEAGRIAMIWETRADGPRGYGTFGMYRELAAHTRTFDALAVLGPWQSTMTGAGRPELFAGQRVSAKYFRALGVPPAIGRDFQEADGLLNAPNVVILSDALWRRRFNADRAIVGRPITLEESATFATSSSYSVIGVMPPGFEDVLAPAAELWAPLQYDMSQGRAWGHHLRTVGRLRPGIGADQATRELNALGNDAVTALHPVTYGKNVAFSVSSLQDDVTRGVRPALLAVLGAVVLVLLIACVNVTNLLLARGAQRRGELAMLAALGASRSRVIRQLLTESLLLAAIGGLAGMAVAEIGVRALVALSPAGLPRAGAIAVDASVFAFGLGLTTLVGLAFGLIPALHAARNDLHTGLQHSSRRTAGGHQVMRRTLVVAEVALALVLLVGSGLLLRSLQRLFAVSPGFESSQLLTMQVQETGHRFDADSTRYRFFAQALEAVRGVNGVASAAFTSQLPLSGDNDIYGMQLETDNAPDEGATVFRYAVSPGYVETMGIPLRRGRLLDEHDVAGSPRAVLINESLARRKFRGTDPIGQHVHVGPREGPWYTIVGVVADVKQQSLAVSEGDAVYVTTAQWHWADNVMSLVVRARGAAAALAPAVRAAIWSADKDLPVVRVATMDDLVAASAAERRFALVLFAAFALVALLLAAAGIYGILSGSVTERTREIGVRSALGASRGDIRNLILRQGMTLAAVGAAIGLAGAVGASRGIETLLFGVTRLDPATYAGVIALLLGVSAIASWVPAWRAARVDPAITLRSE